MSRGKVELPDAVQHAAAIARNNLAGESLARLDTILASDRLHKANFWLHVLTIAPGAVDADCFMLVELLERMSNRPEPPTHTDHQAALHYRKALEYIDALQREMTAVAPDWPGWRLFDDDISVPAGAALDTLRGQLAFMLLASEDLSPGFDPQSGQFKDPDAWWRLRLERVLVDWMRDCTGQPNYPLVALAVEVALDLDDSLDPASINARHYKHREARQQKARKRKAARVRGVTLFRENAKKG